MNSGNNRRPIRHRVKNERGGQSSEVKVRTLGLPLLSGLQFHCLKKGILAVGASLLFVSLNCLLTPGGQRERMCASVLQVRALMLFRNIVSTSF